MKEVSRKIKRTVERELWGRSAGRCEFNGCNEPVYKSPVTQERVSIGEMAHIYSFSSTGPRGWGSFARKQSGLNEPSNLMLVCRNCHKTIDQDKSGTRYSTELLIRWKTEHENRVALVTGVRPSKRSHVILYGANIGDQQSLLQPAAALDALFPDWYPATEQPLELSMSWDGRDDNPSYWATEAGNLKARFDKHVLPLVNDGDVAHFSAFGFAPIPLLALLGSLLTDKLPVEVYQLHREPFRTWKWADEPKNFSFEIARGERPTDNANSVALVLSLSDRISPDRVTNVLGAETAIWEIAAPIRNNDFLKSRHQLSEFRRVLRRTIVEIAETTHQSTPIHIFPAVPVACAIELGRVRMPKVNSKWVIYDHNNRTGGFCKALTLGADA